MKKLTVSNEMSSVDNNGQFATSTRTIESSICAPRGLAAEVFGGGSEYFLFWQLPLWPSSWSRLFAQEEE